MSDEPAAREVSPEEYRQMVATGQVGKKHKTPVYLWKSNNLPVILAAVVVLSLLIGFFGGIAYQKGKKTTATTAISNTNGFGGQSGFGGGQGGFRRGGGAIGQVTAVSDSSITVSNQRTGSDQTFKITSSTTISNNGSAASASDIQTGDTVLIRTSTSDTSTATSILINPSFGGPGGFGGQSQTPNDNSGSSSGDSGSSIDAPSSNSSSSSPSATI